MSIIRNSPVQARSEAKLARILRVAQQIISTEGPEAATTTRIAAESDVSVGVVYRFFSNREGLLNVLVAEELNELDRRLIAVDYRLDGPDWEQRAEAGIDVMVDFADDPTLAYRTLMYTSTLTGEIAETNRDHDLRMAEYLLSGLSETVLASMAPNPLAVVHMYLGILDKGMELAFYRPGYRDEKIIRQMKVASHAYIAQYLN
ncbi:TetR/AcrR family transcriptional regulator [Brevibacterium renqingii]|uniref:TetR/AcrR family transcriptional regulator n=1 Tax=Brevibacterium renqingii TaxID=2776916 RepID=UPI001AE08889|nr:TetR/AcrR family transcriptional regulator [Brevibacterium renqingii]